MARTTTEIEKQIIDQIRQDDNLNINSNSISSVYYRLVIAIAYCICSLEKLFDIHTTQINTAIYEQKSGSLKWYQNMAKAFQFGFNLLLDSDQFDNSGFTPEQIEASKIIKYCSVKESQESNRLTIKVASEQGDKLIPLSGQQKESFEEYLKDIKYAGVKINVVNNPADKLVLNLVIYRNPLVLDQNGNSIAHAGQPVETAIKSYIKALPFDGVLILNDLIATLRAVDGVDNVHIVNATSSAFDPVTGEFLSYAPINVKTIPVSGYFEIVNFDNITYVV